MSIIGKYCKSYKLSQLRQFPNWATSSKRFGRSVFDGVSYVVEINKDQQYRTYLYDNPAQAKCSEAKQMLEIAGIIAEEFDLSEFKTGG